MWLSISAGLSYGKDEYFATNGTSFAAPYATAVAAHVLTVAGMFMFDPYCSLVAPLNLTLQSKIQ